MEEVVGPIPIRSNNKSTTCKAPPSQLGVIWCQTFKHHSDIVPGSASSQEISGRGLPFRCYPRSFLRPRSALALAAMAGIGLSSSTLWASVALVSPSPASKPQDSKRRTDVSESNPQYPPTPPDDLQCTLTLGSSGLRSDIAAHRPCRRYLHHHRFGARRLQVASASSTCTSRRAAVRRLTGMILKRPSFARRRSGSGVPGHKVPRP
jgi:hypothetical protein